jgi:DNA replication licensing factor MCM3
MLYETESPKCNIAYQLQVYYCAYSGSFGENACNPRTLGSNLLNRLVSLEGIVTKCSLVRPKVVKSVHWNEKKQTFHFREYRDNTMTANGAASSSVYPQQDEAGNPVCLVAISNKDSH